MGQANAYVYRWYLALKKPAKLLCNVFKMRLSNN